MACRFSIPLHHSLSQVSPRWPLALAQLLKSSSAMQPLHEPFSLAERKSTWAAFSFPAHLYSSVTLFKKFFLATFFKYSPYLHWKNSLSPCPCFFSPQKHLSPSDLLNNILVNFLSSSTIMGEIRAVFSVLFITEFPKPRTWY